MSVNWMSGARASRFPTGQRGRYQRRCAVPNDGSMDRRRGPTRSSPSPLRAARRAPRLPAFPAAWSFHPSVSRCACPRSGRLGLPRWRGRPRDLCTQAASPLTRLDTRTRASCAFSATHFIRRSTRVGICLKSFACCGSLPLHHLHLFLSQLIQLVHQRVYLLVGLVYLGFAALGPWPSAP